MNEYTDITEYYDLLMTNGYYDYESIAKSLHQALEDRNKILEIGAGTGLLSEQLLKLESNCELTAMDHTESMLEIARERLGDRAKVIQANLISMELDQVFDAAISHGVWSMIDMDHEYHLGTHIPNDEENSQALKNVSKHLRKGGLFLLNIQAPHKEKEFNLPGGIVYFQEALKQEEEAEQYCIQKRYAFKKENEIVAEQTCKYKFFTESATEKLMNEAGFKFKEVNPTKEFHIYYKYQN